VTVTGNPRTHVKDIALAERNALTRAANRFLLDCKARNLSPGTRRFYAQRLAGFFAFLEQHGTTTPEGVTPEQVRAFLAGMVERNASPYYVHQFARTVKTWLRFLVNEGILEAFPLAKIRLPKLPKDLLPPFTPEEVGRLLAACDNERDTALVLTLLDSGVRASELLGLNLADYNAQTGALRVVRGKGGKTRVTFVGVRTRRALARYLATGPQATPDDPLFLTLTTEHRISFFGLQSILRRLGAAAGVKPMGAHRFRRTFALQSLRAGMPVPQLAALMGHEGLAVLQRYLRLLEDDLQAAHAAHGAVDSMLRK
jgi:site-specific recombinase XerD